mgnify:CR=1 FL=1
MEGTFFLSDNLANHRFSLCFNRSKEGYVSIALKKIKDLLTQYLIVLKKKVHRLEHFFLAINQHDDHLLHWIFVVKKD